MKKLLVILSLLTLVVFMFNCKGTTEPKEESSEPFECKVDGKKWVPSVPDDALEDALTVAYSSGYLSITANHFDGSDGEILVLSLSNLTEVGTFNLGSFGSHCWAEIIRQVGTTVEDFSTDDSHTGTVEITKFDTNKKKVEGTFSFTAKSATGDNTIQVTNGSFSLTYTAV